MPERGATQPDGSIESILGRAIGGDRGAYEQLLAAVHPLMQRYTRGRIGRAERALGSADDVAQEIALATITALKTYQQQGLSFRAFVYGIAAHKVTDAYRAIGRDRSQPVAEFPDEPLSDRDPEKIALDTERNERLVGQLAKLTPRQREVLILREGFGFSAEQTAEMVSSTPGAVRVTQHRALERLGFRRKTGGVGSEAGGGVDTDSIVYLYRVDDPITYATNPGEIIDGGSYKKRQSYSARIAAQNSHLNIHSGPPEIGPTASGNVVLFRPRRKAS